MYAYLVYYILGFVMIPGIILGIYAQTKVKSTFDKYNSTPTASGKTASEVARLMLNGASHPETKINEVAGELTDHYNPKTDTVSLSSGVAQNNSISAVGVAAHEIGHVFQHKKKYAPVKIRGALVPVLNYSGVLIYIGLGIYALNIVFCLITLPVELNASKRAHKMLVGTNEMSDEEAKCAKSVLNAAAWTYVASLITSVLSLMRVLLFIFAMRGNRD